MKKIVTTLLTIALLWPLFLPTIVLAEEETEAPPFEAAAKHAMAVEVSTGKILYEKDSETPTGVASISKLLTAYLVYEAIEEGQLTLDTKVAISDHSYALTTSAVANVPLDAREYTVDQLLTALLVSSANSPAISLAERVAGTEPKFVDRMQAKLKEWGITDAKLVNASGLNNVLLGEHIYPGSSQTDENQMSAKAVAIVARRLLLDYPQVLEKTSLVNAPWEGQTITTWNFMLEGAPFQRAGVKGLITGTSALSGASFVASSTENNVPVIAVVLGADNGDTNDAAKFVSMNGLLDYVGQNYYMATFISKGQTYDKSQIKLINGLEGRLTTVAKADFNVVQKGNEEATKASFKASKQSVEAPIKKGTSLGTLTLKDKGYLDGPPQMEMVAQTEAERAPALQVWWNEFVQWVIKKL